MITVAMVQLNSTDKVENNFNIAIEAIEKSIKNHADLIVLPEHFLYVGPDKSITFDVSSPQITALQKIAQQSKIFICAGSFLEKNTTADKPFNTSVLIDDNGSIAGIYRKIHLFDVEIHDSIECHESQYTSPGNTLTTVKTPFGMIGMSTCYDLRFPELYRILALRGCDIMLVPSNFALRTGKDHWQVLLQARAIENGSYVIAVNQCGMKYDGNYSYGRSMAIDPWGIPIVQAPNEYPAIVYCKIDRERINKVRSCIPSLQHIKLIDDTTT